jgi:hypothetical protein
VLEEPAYRVTVLSEAGGLLFASAGIRIDCEPFGDADFDRVRFASGVETDFASPGTERFKLMGQSRKMARLKKSKSLYRGHRFRPQSSVAPPIDIFAFSRACVTLRIALRARGSAAVSGLI